MGTRDLALPLLFLSACVESLSTPSLQRPLLASSPALEAGEEASPSPGISYTTIAEVLKHPALFDGRQVRLRGRAVDVRYSISPTGSASTTFDLADSNGNTVKVVTEGHTLVREGLEVTVEGRLALPHPAASSPPLVEVEAAHIVLISPRGKVSARPAATSQPEQSPPSLPAVPPKPPPKHVRDEGRIF